MADRPPDDIVDIGSLETIRPYLWGPYVNGITCTHPSCCAHRQQHHCWFWLEVKASEMAKFSLFFLGSPQVELGEATINVKPRKALALLIYLAVTADRHSRDSLATMLWPNSDQRRARHALRSRLSELNLVLGKNWIQADRESVGLRAEFWLDVTEFQNILAAETADPRSLLAAVELYRGDFTTGFTPPAQQPAHTNHNLYRPQG